MFEKENPNLTIEECHTLYRQYYTMVYRLSLLLLKHPQDAEDAVQAVFLKVLEKQPVFSDEDHTRAWLLTVTRNYCRDIQRSFWHKKRTDMEQLPEQSVEPFDRQESLLFEIFQTLPKKQREVVYLYYFEDYSIKEIAKLLDRNESTVQSQLFAARKRMKKQFSTSKAAALILCMVFTLGFGGIAADAASDGRTTAVIKEMSARIQASIHGFLSEEDQKVANETVMLPIQVYASDLVGINDDYVILANERGLVIYSRRQEAIISVLDLQQLECNYLNADSIATRIFLDEDQLYLFNETDLELRRGKVSSDSLPEFAYIYDLSSLSESSDSTEENAEDDEDYLNIELTSGKFIDSDTYLIRTTDKKEIQRIYDGWLDYAKDHIHDTFDSFYGTAVTDSEAEKYDRMSYSRNSLSWIDDSGKNMLSCLLVYDDSDYELYTKKSDGSFISQKLNLNFITSNSDDATEETDTDSDDSEDTKANMLPAFSYTGEDDVLKAVCAYIMASGEADDYYHRPDASVYIPAPVIYGIRHKDDDLIVFCNLHGYYYFKNGNTLECESGGESPARLRLHPNTSAPGGYEVIEDLRTGDGSEYEKGIKEFCKGYPGMAKKYFSYDQSAMDARESIRTALIRMYVQNNNLDIKYYKDYGWDPIPVD